MTGLNWKFEVNLSHILTLLVLGGGMWAGFNNIVTRVEVQSVQMQNLQGQLTGLQSQVRADTTLVDAKVAAVEGRTRAMEIGYAGMSSDIRNILIGQRDVKDAVERLGAQSARGLK